MRTIKFRARAIQDCQWIVGDLIHKRYNGDDEVIIQEPNCCGTDCDINTVGQFTGLLDKNGKEIYKDDIFKIDSLYGVISWHPNGYWCLHTSKDDVSEHSYVPLGEVIEYAMLEKYDFEVIGNIHDNSELLKGE